MAGEISNDDSDFISLPVINTRECCGIVGCARIPLETIVYRAILYPTWINSKGEIKYQAFIRKFDDADGLSLQRGDRCIAVDVQREFKYDIHGVGQSSTTKIRNINSASSGENLMVCYTSEEEKNGSKHSVICGLESKSETDYQPTPQQIEDARELLAVFRSVK